MNRFIKLILTCFLLFFFVNNFFINTLRGSEILPGSTQDPVVSKSYVDQKFDEMIRLLNTVNLPLNDSNQNFSSISFKPIQVLKGQRLIGHEGTEIILRSGQAIVYSEVQDGLVNVTGASELYNNQPIEMNNLLIVSRYDGRGVYALTDIWVIVKGNYDIV